MKKYIVAKSDDVFVEGAEFKLNKDNNFENVVVDAENGIEYTTKIVVSKSLMYEAIRTGVVKLVGPEMKDHVACKSCACNKCKSAIAELDQLIAGYRDDLSISDFKKSIGSISDEESAEAATTLANLIKLAKHIKSLLN